METIYIWPVLSLYNLEIDIWSFPADGFACKFPNTALEWKLWPYGEGLVLYFEGCICLFWRCTFCLEKAPKNGFQKQKTEMLGNAMSADLVPPDQIIPGCFSTLNSSDISAVFNILLNQDVISLNLTAKAYCQLKKKDQTNKCFLMGTENLVILFFFWNIMMFP